jgi:hypothetical protein
MTNLDWIKQAIIFLSGFLTLIMQSFVPVGGGGISLIFVLTVPFTLGVSILASFLFYWFSSSRKHQSKQIVFFLSVLLNVLISIGMYPYS